MAGLVFIAYELVDEACELFTRAKSLGNKEVDEMIDKYCRK